jgi:hypothetical protein
VSAEHEPDDPLRDELARIYRGLRPPPLADAASAADAETARAVLWMQDAWRGLEVPPARVPLPGRRRARPRLLRPALAAAAAALVLGALALARLLGRRASEPAPPVAQGPADAGAVEILALQAGRVELRSGPVRLVLLAPPASYPTEDSSGG